MTHKKKKRVRRSDRQRLKELKSVVEDEYEEKDADDLDYDDVLSVVLPEATEETIMKRPEEDMVFINLKEERGIFDRVDDLAGENVSAHEVVNHYINQYESRAT